MENNRPKTSEPLSDSDFDSLIRSSSVEVPLSGAFQNEVWRRIAIEKEASWSSRISCWAERLVGPLVRPMTATAAILAMASAGMWLGAQGDRLPSDGKQAYIASISPFSHEHQGGAK